MSNTLQRNGILFLSRFCKGNPEKCTSFSILQANILTALHLPLSAMLTQRGWQLPEMGDGHTHTQGIARC